MWTKNDQKQLEELQARKAQFEATHKSHVIDFVRTVPNLPDAGFSPMVDYLIKNADLLRDVLAPFDSGVRVAERPLDETGWIEWRGGNCPVRGATRVEVKLRNGFVNNDLADRFGWRHNSPTGIQDHEIVAYRVLD